METHCRGCGDCAGRCYGIDLPEVDAVAELLAAADSDELADAISPRNDDHDAAIKRLRAAIRGLTAGSAGKGEGQ